MDKEDVVCVCVYTHTHTHTHTMECYSFIKKNKIMPFAATWVDLEIVILCEVRHRKTNMILFICGILKKKSTNELIYKTKVESRM